MKAIKLLTEQTALFLFAACSTNTVVCPLAVCVEEIASRLKMIPTTRIMSSFNVDTDRITFLLGGGEIGEEGR